MRLLVGVWVMLAFAALLFPLVFRHGALTRGGGAVLLAAYGVSSRGHHPRASHGDGGGGGSRTRVRKRAYERPYRLSPA